MKVITCTGNFDGTYTITAKDTITKTKVNVDFDTKERAESVCEEFILICKMNNDEVNYTKNYPIIN